MTNGSGFSLEPRGHDLTHFSLAIGATHPLHESFDQWAALRNAELVKRWADLLAAGVNALRQSASSDRLLRLRREGAPWPGEAVGCRRERLAFALACLVTNDFSQLHIEQAGLLPRALRERLTQGTLPRWERLREPRSSWGSCACLH